MPRRLVLLVLALLASCGRDCDHALAFGYVECTSDRECLRACLDDADRAMTTAPPIALVSSSCERDAVDAGFYEDDAYCACEAADDEGFRVGPTTRRDCALDGVTHECLIAADDVAPCDPGVVDDCAATCAAAVLLVNEDRARRRTVAVAEADCRSQRCDCTLVEDGRCFRHHGEVPCP